MNSHIQNHGLTMTEQRVERKAKIRNRYNQAPYLTQNSAKIQENTTRRREPGVLPFAIPFAADDQNAAKKRQGNITKTNNMTHAYKNPTKMFICE